MRLNRTYKLTDMLGALTAASETPKQVSEILKAEGRHMQVYTVYEAEGMLSSSPYARVTLIRKVSDTRWEGYMETSLFRDGPKTPVAVNCTEYTLVANDDFTEFTIQM